MKVFLCVCIRISQKRIRDACRPSVLVLVALTLDVFYAVSSVHAFTKAPCKISLTIILTSFNLLGNVTPNEFYSSQPVWHLLLLTVWESVQQKEGLWITMHGMQVQWMQFTVKQWCIPGSAEWLQDPRVMSLMVLTDVEWVRELATFCSHDTSYQIFKTQATITTKVYWAAFFSWRWEHKAWATMSVNTTLFQACDLFHRY